MVDHATKQIRISIRSAEIRAALEEKEARNNSHGEGVSWHPEFGAWMIESTPSQPYADYATGLMRVEQNMRLRRRRLLTSLTSDEIAPTVTSFPLMGVGRFYSPDLPFSAPYSESSLVPDFAINPHPRFGALTRNIMARRGSKVDIRVPLFHDRRTPEYLRQDAPEHFKVGEHISALEPDTDIHMDCMAFGMGMCCLQVTFQGTDVDESRFMYDQLAVLAPIMLAITAASPIYKGRLADVDARWSVIAQSVDDRTPAERGLVPTNSLESVADPYLAGRGIVRQIKSRYDSISTYIYHCQGDTLCHRTFERYNDVWCPVDEEVKTQLREAGVDHNLAHHVAHLFTRDPLVIFKGHIELDDAHSTDHFENIQSTNWQTCRWKPPPPRESLDDPHIGWRTELRSMEVQLTDFENAALSVFVVLLNRVVLAFDLSFYMPLSRVDENMVRAQMRDAAVAQKFFFRSHIAPPDASCNCATHDSIHTTARTDPTRPETLLDSIDSYEEMSLSEIFNGKGSYFPGLIPLVYAYLEHIECDQDPEVFTRLDQYLQFISDRAKGRLMTCATWQRKFILNHPAYNHDSVVSSEIAYDLMMACKNIGEGHLQCPELYGNVVIDK